MKRFAFVLALIAAFSLSTSAYAKGGRGGSRGGARTSASKSTSKKSFGGFKKTSYKPSGGSWF